MIKSNFNKYRKKEKEKNTNATKHAHTDNSRKKVDQQYKKAILLFQINLIN